MAKTPPGQTRARVFKWTRQRILAGEPPTVREVQEAFGFSAVQTARQHLEALVEEGRLTVERGRSRGYRLAEAVQAPPPRLVPVVGRVQAGALSLAVEDIEGYVPVESRGDDVELFALTVRGESMLGAGILPGDVVVVRRQQRARSGEIVVALVGEEATVKTLSVKGDRIELRPANPDFAPIVLSAEEVTILGKVIEVRRNLG